MKAAKWLAVTLMLVLGMGVASAQEARLIETPSDKAFKHKHSGLRLPPAIDGLPRVRIVELVDDQLDVFANYEVAGQNALISVYVYRQVAGAVPVWFDMARLSIENRADTYGNAKILAAPLTFMPPGQSTESGLIASYDVETGKFKSTAVALTSLGEWLIKIRYSSDTLGAEELGKRTQAVLAALEWPSKMPPAPTIRPIAPCTTTLALSGRSQAAPPDGATALMAATIAMMGTKATEETASAATSIWCQDPTRPPMGIIYRFGEEKDGYLIALADSGLGIRIEPSAAAKLMAASNKDSDAKTSQSWSIDFPRAAQTISFAPQDRLPPPDQVLEIVQGGKPVSTVTTWGKKNTIEINPDAMK